jgi:hypothetical protein
VRKNRKHVGAGKQQSVTVVLCSRDSFGSQHRSGARAIFDDDRLAKRRAHFFGQQTRMNVELTAGCVRNHHLDRAIGIGLSARALRSD